MWSTFFHDGGWGMWPTAIFGFLLVASGVLCVLRPERRFIPLVASFAVTTLGAGVLGTAVGMAKSFHYLPGAPADRQFLFAALGTAESLNDTILALMLVVLTGLLCAVAALRAATRDASAV